MAAYSNSELIKKINNFFTIEVPEIYSQHKGNKVRDSLIKERDILKYLFYYSNINNGKEYSALKTKKNHSYDNFDRKIKNVSIKFFNVLLKKSQKLFNDIIKDPNIAQIYDKLNGDKCVLHDDDNNNYSLKSVDGSCYNTIRDEKLFTNLDLHIYNNNTKTGEAIISNDTNARFFSNNVNNNSDKNNEIELFMKYIKNNLDDKKTIYLFDRAYASYELIQYLINNDIKFIIRLKENFEILKDQNDINKHNQNEKIIKFIKDNKNIKIVSNRIKTTKDFALSTNKQINVNIDAQYYLITNLGDHLDYSDSLIINLYNKRWEIETYIGILKKIFKYDILYLNDNDFIEKLKIIENILIIFVRLFIFISLNSNLDKSLILLDPKVNKKFNKKKYDMRKKEFKKKYNDFINEPYYYANVYVNLSLFYKFFNDNIIFDLIDGNITNDIILQLNESIKIKKDKKHRHFNRKSHLPFSKWYVKMYHKIYQDKKILNAILNNKIDDLNKNLKCKALNILKKINKNDLYDLM